MRPARPKGAWREYRSGSRKGPAACPRAPPGARSTRPGEDGAHGRTRTCDARLRTAALCPLSYVGPPASYQPPPCDLAPGAWRRHDRARRTTSPRPRARMRPMVIPPPPADRIVLYGAEGCHLCEAARAVVVAHLASRADAGRPGRLPRGRGHPRGRPSLPRLPRDDPRPRGGRCAAGAGDERRRGSGRSSTRRWMAPPRPGRARAPARRARRRGRRPMSRTSRSPWRSWPGSSSFLSPCVLPLVPAYLGQLTAVAVAGRESGPRHAGSPSATRSRTWWGSGSSSRSSG